MPIRTARRTGRRRRTDVRCARRRLAWLGLPAAVEDCSAPFIDTVTNINVTSTTRLSGPRRSARVTRWLLHRKWQKFNWSLKKVWSESSQNVLTVHFSLQKVINSAEMISLRSVQVKKFAISRSRTSDYRVTWLETALWLSSYFHIFRECLFGDSKYGYLGTFWRSSVFSKRPEVFKLNTNISY